MSHILDHLSVPVKITGEVVALGAIGGTLLDKLPYVAAVMAIIWHGCLFYDWVTKKIRRNRRKGDKNNKKE